MELVIKGTIKTIGEVNVVSDKFKKVEFSIETSDQYPKTVAFQITNDKIDNFLKYNKVGQSVEVKFNAESKEYNGRFFTNLTAWRVQNLATNAQAQNTAPALPTQNEVVVEESDLPF